jgi:uncharacterized protein (TIGR03437 family)
MVSALPEQPRPPQPPAQAQAVVTTIGNAASPWPGALVAGSLASIKGSRLQGTTVSVTFDDIPGQVLRVSNSELVVLVPADLAEKSSARMTILVDGAASGPHTVSLAAAAPAIFPNGVLNENNSVNGLNAPAAVGSYLQIFATGLLPAVGQAAVTAKIHDREVMPVFAGPGGGSGVHQVNVRVPEDLPAMTTEVLLCVSVNGDDKVCSLPVHLTLVR